MKPKRAWILIGLLAFAACDSVTSLYDQGMEMLGLAPVQQGKKDKSKKDTKKPKTAKQDDTDTATPESQDSVPTGDIVVKTQKGDDKKPQKSNLKNATAAVFTVEAPVDVQKRIGGNARFITSDAQYLYLDFPQHFAVYDQTLKELAHNPVAYPVQRVQLHEIKGKFYLYLQEENHVFEIFELQSKVEGANKSYSLVDVKSFEVDGDYVVVSANELAVFLKDKVQLLDLSDFNSIKILGELDLPGVTAGVAFGKYLYLAQGVALNVVDVEKQTILSSVKIGKNFGFLGAIDDGGKRLILTQLAADGSVSGVQYLRLTEDYSGVTDFGENQIFEKNLLQVEFDAKQMLIIGKESSSTGDSRLALYSLPQKRFLRGALGDLKNLISWSYENGAFDRIDAAGISLGSIQLNQDVISRYQAVQKTLDDTPKTTPLAQIGATKTVLDEYAIVTSQKKQTMADSQKVVLLDSNNIIVFEKTEGDVGQRIFASENFATENFVMKEITPDIPLQFERLLSTDFGILGYVGAGQKLKLIDVKFHFSDLPIVPDKLLSWQWYTASLGEVLILTVKKNDPKIPYAVQIYLLKSPTEAELLSELPFDQPTVAFRSPNGKLGIFQPSRIDFYDLDDLRKPEFNRDETVLFADRKYQFLAAKLTPLQDRILVLFEQDKALKIMVLDVKDYSRRAILEDFEITLNEFDGATFSRGGQLLILPTDEGTLFYDMKDLKNIREAAHWPLPAEYADIADAGRYVCVALGMQGVYCGNLLF